jgi:hypothetical protein
MTSDDRPKLPRATVRDEKLYVEGEKEPYFQDLREGTIYLRVDALTVYGGYDTGNKAFSESLRGKARLEHGWFALIGVEAGAASPRCRLRLTRSWRQMTSQLQDPDVALSGLFSGFGDGAVLQGFSCVSLDEVRARVV